MASRPTISEAQLSLRTLDTVGIDKIEVLREPNSALYGSDALAGVVSLTTARGSTLLPAADLFRRWRQLQYLPPGEAR